MFPRLLALGTRERNRGIGSLAGISDGGTGDSSENDDDELNRRAPVADERL
jgi:hypothetical protein